MCAKRGSKTISIVGPIVIFAVFLMARSVEPTVTVIRLILFYGTFSFFVARLLAEYVLGVELFVATLFVCLSPAVLYYAREQGPVAPMLAAFAGFVCYLKRCDFFKNREEAILSALFLGAAACFRPVEALGTAALLGVRYFFRAKQLGRVNRLDGIWFLISVFWAGLLLYLGEPCLLVLGVIPILLRHKLGLSANFWWFNGVVYLVMAVGFARGFAASPPLAVPGNKHESPLSFFILLVDFFSWPYLAAAFAIAILRMKAVGRYWRMALMFVPAIFLPALIGSLAGRAEYNYYLPAALFAYQVAAYPALQKGRRAYKVRILLMSGVVLLVLETDLRSLFP